jgi:hypothetical protein
LFYLPFAPAQVIIQVPLAVVLWLVCIYWIWEFAPISCESVFENPIEVHLKGINDETLFLRIEHRDGASTF